LGDQLTYSSAQVSWAWILGGSLALVLGCEGRAEYLHGGSGGADASGIGGGEVGYGVGGYLDNGFPGSGGGDPGYVSHGSGGEIWLYGDAWFDDSEAAGPCGQWVNSLDAYCVLNNDCQPEELPTCATLEELPDWYPEGTSGLWEGCGFTKYVRPLGEGDAETSIWFTDDHELAMRGTVGALSIGCSVKGSRYGEAPACDEWVSLCDAGGAAGQ